MGLEIILAPVDHDAETFSERGIEIVDTLISSTDRIVVRPKNRLDTVRDDPLSSASLEKALLMPRTRQPFISK